METTKKMTQYFKKSFKYHKTHHNNTDNHHPSMKYYNATHSNKHRCKSHNTSDHVNEIISQTSASKTINQTLMTSMTPMTMRVLIVTLTPHQTQNY